MISRNAARLGRKTRSLSPASLERMMNYPWPGNIRELENVVERAMILWRAEELEVDAALLPTVSSTAQSSTGFSTLEQAAVNHIFSAFEKSNWVIEGAAGAARLLDVHPNTLRSRIRKLGLKRPAHEVS